MRRRQNVAFSIGIQSVSVTDARDVMAEMRTLAARANALHKEGLTAWHETTPRVEGPTGIQAAVRRITHPPTNLLYTRGVLEQGWKHGTGGAKENPG